MSHALIVTFLLLLLSAQLSSGQTLNVFDPARQFNYPLSDDMEIVKEYEDNVVGSEE